MKEELCKTLLNLFPVVPDNIIRSARGLSRTSESKKLARSFGFASVHLTVWEAL